MKLFNEPWMDELDDQLLVRYWRSKGSPGVLEVWKHGMTIRHFRTYWGEFSLIWAPEHYGSQRGLEEMMP